MTPWNVRINTQLDYLRELNAATGAGLEDLIGQAEAMLTAKAEQDGTLTQDAGLEIEMLLLPASKLAKAITVSCVGHAHIDMN